MPKAPKHVRNESASSQDNQGHPVNIPLESTLEPAFRDLLDLVRNSGFYLRDEHEPIIGTEEGDAFLAQSDKIQEYLGQSLRSQVRDKSIYHLLIDEKSTRCRLCGASKSAPVRVLQCVRAHLDHRPFHCPGIGEGCKRCTDASKQVS
jgi:hypothetical protein